MPKARLAGFVVRVHVSVVVALAALIWMGQAVRGALLLASVVLHELAHAAVARRLGVRVYEVEIFPFGGVARVDEPAMVEPGAEIRVAAAGPALNGAVALVAGAVQAGLAARGEVAAAFWGMLAADQLGLALFNLLPALPLDGGRVVRALLARRVGFFEATRLACGLGSLAGLAMMAAGLASYGGGETGLWSAAMGGFLVYAAGRERRRSPSLWVRYLHRLSEPAPGREVREVRALAAPRDSTVRDVLRLWVPGRYHLLVVTDGSGKAVGLVDERALVDAMLGSGPHMPLGRLGYRRW